MTRESRRGSARIRGPVAAARLLLARCCLLAACLLLAACQSTGPGPLPSGGSAGTGATGGPGGAGQDTGGASRAPVEELLSLELEDGPIITATDGPEGAQYALPAAAARDRDGGYVLFIVWFGDVAGESWVTVSRSADLQTWDVGREPIFGDLGLGAAQPGPIPSAALQLDDGSWLLYGWAADPTRDSYFTSWRASAPDLDGPWALDRARILVPGTPGTWDSASTTIAGVQHTASGYVAWYEGQPPGNAVRGDTGFATSSDGLTWQKHDDPATATTERYESDPVIRRGVCAGTEQAVFQPQVEPIADGYLAIIGGFATARDEQDLYGAVSADGIEWRCGAPSPLLRAADIPGSTGIHQIASLPLGDGRVGVVVESLHGEASELWLATVTPRA